MFIVLGSIIVFLLFVYDSKVDQVCFITILHLKKVLKEHDYH